MHKESRSTDVRRSNHSSQSSPNNSTGCGARIVPFPHARSSLLPRSAVTGGRGAPIDHPGTPRLFERDSYNPVAKGSGPFYFPDGRARFNVAEHRDPVDDASDEYPIYLTTGRVVSQFLSGTQTRRIGPLVKQYPEPRIEIHPRLASTLGIADGDWATAETRRGAITLRAMVVTTIRPDTIFIPCHWPRRKSPNRLTVAAQDPISKIPQYKVCGCRVKRADGPPEYEASLEPQQ
jgi:assimilatory nitrate reductase catalytic subunit